MCVCTAAPVCSVCLLWSGVRSRDVYLSVCLWRRLMFTGPDGNPLQLFVKQEVMCV